MSEAHHELDALREAVRPRLAKATVKALRDLAECYEMAGDRNDRILASGLSVLLDMHDRLEAIRHGQA